MTKDKSVDPFDGETRLVGRLDPETGKEVIVPLVQTHSDPAQAIINAERIANQSMKMPDELVEREQALMLLIRDMRLQERHQIVHTVMAYAEDCEDRATRLEESLARERRRLMRTNHVTEAEELRKSQGARVAAFRVRAALAADIAHKIDTEWGRNPDGSPMEKVDTESEDVMHKASRMNREAAKLKSV